jgi:hypothetical protein
MQAQMALVVVVVIVVLLLLGLAGARWWSGQRRRSAHLREQFGPEYDRVVNEHGEPGAAEAALEQRAERVRQLHIQPLPAEDETRFADDWRSVQARFVDDPEASVKDADGLVEAVMQARGYPIANFEQRAADISVDHPAVVENYRSAHAIAVRDERQLSTEDLRRAMVYYRSLFEELLSPEVSARH